MILVNCLGHNTLQNAEIEFIQGLEIIDKPEMGFSGADSARVPSGAGDILRLYMDPIRFGLLGMG